MAVVIVWKFDFSAISAYYDLSCEFESRSWQGVLKFVSDMRQGFSWYSGFLHQNESPRYNWNIAEGDVKHYKQSTISKIQMMIIWQVLHICIFISWYLDDKIITFTKYKRSVPRSINLCSLHCCDLNAYSTVCDSGMDKRTFVIRACSLFNYMLINQVLE